MGRGLRQKIDRKLGKNTSTHPVAGRHYDLYRAYALPQNGKLRIQMDMIIYHPLAFPSTKACPECGLPLQQLTALVVGINKKFCTICGPKMLRDAYRVVCMKDFDPGDTAAQAEYLVDLKEEASRRTQNAQEQFEFRQWLSQTQKDLNAQNNLDRFRVKFDTQLSLVWLCSPGLTDSPDKIDIGRSPGESAANRASTKAKIDFLLNEMEDRNQRLELEEREQKIVDGLSASKLADSHLEAQVSARALRQSIS